MCSFTEGRESVSLLIEASTRSPGVVMAATSGTTMALPVKTTLSPALALSTMSCLRMTSVVRGRLPAGTYTVKDWLPDVCISV